MDTVTPADQAGAMLLVLIRELTVTTVARKVVFFFLTKSDPFWSMKYSVVIQLEVNNIWSNWSEKKI